MGGICKSRTHVQDENKPPNSLHIGGLFDRNDLSFQPMDFEVSEHTDYPTEFIASDEEVFQHYLLNLEADYVIKMKTNKSSTQKFSIFEKQLTDLGLKPNEDYFMVAIKKADSVLDQAASLMSVDKAENAVFHDRSTPGGNMKFQFMNQAENNDIYYAIKFSGESMNNLASKHKVFADLDISNIRLPYSRLMNREFTQFDARQRYIIIMKELETQIDFDRFMELEIIEDHYPLHRSGTGVDFEEAFKKYDSCCSGYFTAAFDIICCGCCGKTKTFDKILNMFKKYFGEKYAFFYGYYRTYNAYLLEPMIVGMTCFGYQIYTYITALNSEE